MTNFYVLLVFAIVYHKSEIRNAEATETEELIQDIELGNQKMKNLIRMKMVVTNLMTAIIRNQILTLIKEETNANRVTIHTQDASYVNETLIN